MSAGRRVSQLGGAAQLTYLSEGYGTLDAICNLRRRPYVALASRAKVAQEKRIKNAAIPYSIVQATQFFEFIKGIAHFSMQVDKVHLPPVLFQPMAADDVATG